MLSVNGARLLERINELGTIGKDEEGRRTRLAASDTEKQGRDKVVSWMEDADLKVVVVASAISSESGKPRRTRIKSH